jgi:hypothetical protein
MDESHGPRVRYTGVERNFLQCRFIPASGSADRSTDRTVLYS